jgi:hypothetical protein
MEVTGSYGNIGNYPPNYTTPVIFKFISVRTSRLKQGSSFPLGMCTRAAWTQDVCSGLLHGAMEYSQNWVPWATEFTACTWASESEPRCDRRSVSLGVEPIWGSWPEVKCCLTVRVFWSRAPPITRGRVCHCTRAYQNHAIYIYIGSVYRTCTGIVGNGDGLNGPLWHAWERSIIRWYCNMYAME